MIQEIDEQLRSWANALLPGAEISLDAPQPERAGRGATIYLMQFTSAPPARGSKQPPLQVLARFLVTTWAEDAIDAHAMLETLLFSAMTEEAYTVDLTPLASETWATFGLCPRPAFSVSIMVKQARTHAVPKRVSHPIEIGTAPLVVLHGTVLGPNDIAVAGASVEVPALQLSTRSDALGHFRFVRVPAQPSITHLRVQAKGQRQEVSVDLSALADAPLLIRFTSFDESFNVEN